jgi:tRNA U34 5-carboxymethylaminomethyl modifying GTPase MnmE/TrmE
MCWNSKVTAARWFSTCVAAPARARLPHGAARRIQRARLSQRQDRHRAGRSHRRLDRRRHRRRGARRCALLQGEFSARIDDLQTQITGLRVYVEAAIDFPDEEIDFLVRSVVAAAALGRIRRLRLHQAAARQGALLREGLTVVIAGRPNAGKSSLLNRLAGEEVAIVTDLPGTTRDVLRRQVHLDGLPLNLVDTAGLRPAADVVEAEGVRRARQEIARADRVLYILDAGHCRRERRGDAAAPREPNSKACPPESLSPWYSTKSI